MPQLTSPAARLSPEAVLAVAYADARAAELSFALGLPRKPALRVLEVQLAGLAVELRILGYSHQVLVTGDASAPLLSETVARLSGDDLRGARAGALPAVHRARRAAATGLLHYSMSSSIAPLGDDPAGIEALMTDLDDAADGVLGVFPGHPHAFTGLRARKAASGGVEWRSWHAYPGADELVRTQSRLVVQAP